MPSITGRVEVANSKPQTTRFGQRAKIGLKINGEWYNALAEEGFDVNRFKGHEVTVNYTDDTYGHSLDVKSIKITGAALASPAAVVSAPTTTAPKTAWAGEAGVRVGMGINNAVLLAAHGKIRLESIPVVAAQIIRLNADLNDEYNDILGVDQGWVLKSPAVASQSAVAPTAKPTPTATAAPTPEPPQAPAAVEAPKKTRRRAVATEAVPTTSTAPIAIPVATIAPAPAEGVPFDDDIPF